MNCNDIGIQYMPVITKVCSDVIWYRSTVMVCRTWQQITHNHPSSEA